MPKFTCTVVAITLSWCLSQQMAQAQGTTVDLDGRKSTTPATWKAADKTSNKFRLYQFALPKAAGDDEDAELVIFYFGPGSGGSVKDNVKRWKDTFSPPPGKTIDDYTKIETFKLGNVPVTYVEIEGTYLSKFPPFAPNAKTVRKENYRFLGAVFDSEPNGPYFIRLTGPARTVARDKEAFEKWLKGFK